MTPGEKQWTASHSLFEAGMGTDTPVPYGYEQDFHRPEYPIDRVDPKDFFAEADIEKAKARMKGWVEVLARSGR